MFHLTWCQESSILHPYSIVRWKLTSMHSQYTSQASYPRDHRKERITIQDKELESHNAVKQLETQWEAEREVEYVRKHRTEYKLVEGAWCLNPGVSDVLSLSVPSISISPLKIWFIRPQLKFEVHRSLEGAWGQQGTHALSEKCRDSRPGCTSSVSLRNSHRGYLHFWGTGYIRPDEYYQWMAEY